MHRHFHSLCEAIEAENRERVTTPLKERPALATATVEGSDRFEPRSTHHRYTGDSPLHAAAAGYRIEIANALLAVGADVDAHDQNGATPLHRAVRNRCAAAVNVLLDHGADATLRNRPGSTPFHFAVQTTGRGGSGSEAAKATRRAIIVTLLERGLHPSLKNANGKALLDQARSDWIRQLRAVGKFAGGKMTDAWKWYRGNGNLLQTGSFVAEKKSGVCKRYRPHGVPHDEGSFSDNQKIGDWRAYDAKGKLVKTTKHKIKQEKS